MVACLVSTMPHVVTMNTTFRYITANVHMVSVVKTAKVMSHHKVISDLNHATTTTTATGTGQKAIRQMSKTTAT